MIIKKYPCTRFDRFFFGFLIFMAPALLILLAVAVGYLKGNSP